MDHVSCSRRIGGIFARAGHSASSPRKYQYEADACIDWFSRQGIVPGASARRFLEAPFGERAIMIHCSAVKQLLCLRAAGELLVLFAQKRVSTTASSVACARDCTFILPRDFPCSLSRAAHSCDFYRMRYVNQALR